MEISKVIIFISLPFCVFCCDDKEYRYKTTDVTDQNIQRHNSTSAARKSDVADNDIVGLLSNKTNSSITGARDRQYPSNLQQYLTETSFEKLVDDFFDSHEDNIDKPTSTKSTMKMTSRKTEETSTPSPRPSITIRFPSSTFSSSHINTSSSEQKNRSNQLDVANPTSSKKREIISPQNQINMTTAPVPMLSKVEEVISSKSIDNHAGKQHSHLEDRHHGENPHISKNLLRVVRDLVRKKKTLEIQNLIDVILKVNLDTPGKIRKKREQRKKKNRDHRKLEVIDEIDGLKPRYKSTNNKSKTLKKKYLHRRQKKHVNHPKIPHRKTNSHKNTSHQRMRKSQVDHQKRPKYQKKSNEESRIVEKEEEAIRTSKHAIEEEDDGVDMWIPGDPQTDQPEEADDVVIEDAETEEIKMGKDGKLKAVIKHPKNMEEKNAVVESNVDVTNYHVEITKDDIMGMTPDDSLITGEEQDEGSEDKEDSQIENEEIPSSDLEDPSRVRLAAKAVNDLDMST